MKIRFPLTNQEFDSEDPSCEATIEALLSELPPDTPIEIHGTLEEFQDRC